MPRAHLDEALAGLDPRVRAALEEAIRRVRQASAAQVPSSRTRRRPKSRLFGSGHPRRAESGHVRACSDLLPPMIVKLLPNFNDIKITKYTRKESEWDGSYSRLMSEKPPTK